MVNNAKTLVQAGDAQARTWLAQYLMGKAFGSALTQLTVVVQQLNGVGPLVARLARKFIHSRKFPEANGAFKDQIRALAAAELAGKLPALEIIESPVTARVCGPSAAK